VATPLSIGVVLESASETNVHSVYRCSFEVNKVCLDWFKHLVGAIRARHKLQDTFAFAFHVERTDAIRTSSDTSLEASKLRGRASFTLTIQRMYLTLPIRYMTIYEFYDL